MGKIMYKGENFPGGPNVLSELRDINFSNVQDKQIILYDSTSRTWKNHTITAADVAYDENNSVAETISSLNSALSISKYEASTFTVWKIGKTIYFIAKAWIVSNSSVPPEYKPDKTYYFPATDNAGAAVYVAVDPTDGKLINQRNSNNFITCATWYTG